MTFNQSAQGSDRRISLPPIHTLDLPFLPRRVSANELYEPYDNLKFYPLTLNNLHHERHSPFSSSSASSSSSSSQISSRNPSPAPSSDSDADSIAQSTTKFRLIPCTLEEADAAILVPSQDVVRSQQDANHISRQGTGKGILLVGPALEHMRHPQRPLTRGARLHPYRIVRPLRNPSFNPSEAAQHHRRPSVISVTSFSP